MVWFKSQLANKGKPISNQGGNIYIYLSVAGLFLNLFAKLAIMTYDLTEDSPVIHKKVFSIWKLIELV